MNRRTLKKHCIGAKAVLIARHGYSEAAFSAARGDESIYAPSAMERRHVSNGFLDPGPLKGTPVLWERVSVEYDEWDCFLATERLEQIEAYENFDADMMCADASDARGHDAGRDEAAP